jgi:tetratricopeptide (TPR) repeat protein
VPPRPPARGRPQGPAAPTTRPEPEVWIDEGSVEPPARPRKSAGRRSAGAVRVRAPQLVDLVGAKRAGRLEERLSDAATAFAAERYPDARRILAPIVEEVPDLAEGRELYGLTLYRLGRWREAATQLEAFVDLTGGSTEQHPVLADCRRALGQYAKVNELWEELRSASPSGALVAEGRIVAAGALADQGKLADAVALLGKGFRLPKKPMDHHLRRAYALADLYDRAGDAPQARSLFGQIARIDPDYLDAAERATGA